jgi:hypothetical protein
MYAVSHTFVKPFKPRFKLPLGSRRVCSVTGFYQINLRVERSGSCTSRVVDVNDNTEEEAASRLMLSISNPLKRRRRGSWLGHIGESHPWAYLERAVAQYV